MSETLDEKFSGFIEKSGDEITVDWQKIATLSLNARDGSRGSDLHLSILGELTKLGILSSNPNNNYRLDQDGLTMNPTTRVGLSPYYYFTRQEDAEAYKKAGYPNNKRVRIYQQKQVG